MKSNQREVRLYEATKNLFEIREDGTIWRKARRQANRWTKRVSIVPIQARRAECKTSLGYLQVSAHVDNQDMMALAHRLVWVHFHGHIPAGKQVNHKDGNKSNNDPVNLELVSASENLKHAYRIGLKDQRGEVNPAAKLTDAQVEQIRLEYAQGNISQSAIAKRYRVQFQQISRIVRGERRPMQGGPIADYTTRRNHGKTSRDPLTGQFR